MSDTLAETETGGDSFELTILNGARDGAILAAVGFAYVGESRIAAATAVMAFLLSQVAYWGHKEGGL